MQYKQLSITAADAALREILIAKLAKTGFDGFEETGGKLFAYIITGDFDVAAVETILAEHAVAYEVDDVEEQNWNAQWEASFEPVIVPGFCTVRAHFHNIDIGTPYEVVITPQMSFGTGHHATTMLMMMQMQQMDFVARSVLDFGTGTGILAILSAKLGAAQVLAVDSDTWSYQNAMENIKQNSCTSITVLQGSLEYVKMEKFDIILANINRNILLTYMNKLATLVAKDGYILMSGLLKEDLDIVNSAAIAEGLSFISTNVLNNWINLLVKK
ncbi:MAG: hypothetical protein BGO69_14275 [Bacteroidetes bacterium 46-16]|nr:MAG: hypothetical protein BGO69_14275 [Bacteroidetes bacterium 46-16]